MSEVEKNICCLRTKRKNNILILQTMHVHFKIPNERRRMRIYITESTGVGKKKRGVNRMQISYTLTKR